MSSIECYSVKLQWVRRITPKCWKVKDWQGTEALIPASCFFYADIDFDEEEAYWIASWFLERAENKLQFSNKKVGWFSTEKNCVQVQHKIKVKIEKHIPEKIERKEVIENVAFRRTKASN